MKIVIHCDRCKLRAKEATFNEIEKCCDYGEYLQELVERCTPKVNPQMVFNHRGDIVHDEPKFGIGKLTRRDWRRLYSGKSS